MHGSTHYGYDFAYNGDYSGEIRIFPEDDGPEFEKTFQELATTALFDSPALAFTMAARGFVAEAAVHEAISRLEQMDTEEILANSWLRVLLGEMTTT